jgi:hypothetical protein
VRAPGLCPGVFLASGADEIEEVFVIIDCDSCEVRGLACGDCVVSALLGGPPGEIDDDEVAALDALAGSGLVRALRLVVPVEVLRHPPPEAPGPPGAGDRGGDGRAAAG